MAKFLQFRDGGATDEKGISTHLYGFFDGEVINGLAVTQDSPLGMSVNVSQGRCMIDSEDDYPYLGFTDDDETVTIATADGSNPRIDAIVAYVDLAIVDDTDPNNPDAFDIVAVAGTPAGSPNAPNDAAIESAIGGGNPFIRLAHVTVGTGVTTITTGNVSDQRVMVTIQDDKIANDAITTAKIDDGAVTSSKLDLQPQTDTVAAGQTTSSTTFTDLATVGPSVTVNIGPNGLALVSVHSQFVGDNTAQNQQIAVQASGANTIANSTYLSSGTTSGISQVFGGTKLLTGLNPGSTTFICKYRRVGAGSLAEFANRSLSVVPL